MNCKKLTYKRKEDKKLIFTRIRCTQEIDQGYEIKKITVEFQSLIGLQ